MYNKIFIVLEGCDRTGKTTQSRRSAACLSCQPVLRFLDRTTISGQCLDTYLKENSPSMLDA